MAVVLALASAVAYGVSDFAGGLCSRQAHFTQVMLITQVGSAAAVFLAIAGSDHELPGAAPLAWGAASGLGNAGGGLFLYRGFGRARIGVVAPLSALGSALLPVLVGISSGERPPILTGIGIACAVPAVVLVARPASASVSGEPLRTSARPRGVLDGLLAGAGFGLLFIALQRAGTSHGLWPVGAGQLVAVFIVVAVALTQRRRNWSRPSPPVFGGSVLAGLLAAAAVLLYFLATGHGILALVAVLAALYPAMTVLLARLVLREHMGTAQKTGLGLAALAIVLMVT
jgi:drug/metabolite transporter (DMT)-like permease